MSEDEKAPLSDIPFPEIDFPKEVIDSEEDSGADKTKRLSLSIPFNDISPKFVDSPYLAVRKSIGLRLTIKSTEMSRRPISWLPRIFVWL